MPCPVHCGVLRRVSEININRDIFSSEIMPADFADDKQHIMRFHGGALLRDFDDIMVIRTGKAFIRRDNKIAFAPFGAFALRACIKKLRAGIRGNIKDLCKAVLHHKKEGLCVFKISAGLLKL